MLGRALKHEETIYFSEMIPRIAAILLLGLSIDANYPAYKAAAIPWKDGTPTTQVRR